MQQLWTITRTNGPDRLGLVESQAGEQFWTAMFRKPVTAANGRCASLLLCYLLLCCSLVSALCSLLSALCSLLSLLLFATHLVSLLTSVCPVFGHLCRRHHVR